MKIAIVTNDEITISLHFGRASKYAVYTVDDGKILQRELREKLGHRQFAQEEKDLQHKHQDDGRGHGYGKHAEDKLRRMFANIMDCEIVLARGMGRGAYQGMLGEGTFYGNLSWKRSSRNFVARLLTSFELLIPII